MARIGTPAVEDRGIDGLVDVDVDVPPVRIDVGPSRGQFALPRHRIVRLQEDTGGLHRSIDERADRVARPHPPRLVTSPAIERLDQHPVCVQVVICHAKTIVRSLFLPRHVEAHALGPDHLVRAEKVDLVITRHGGDVGEAAPCHRSIAKESSGWIDALRYLGDVRKNAPVGGRSIVGLEGTDALSLETAAARVDKGGQRVRAECGTSLPARSSGSGKQISQRPRPARRWTNFMRPILPGPVACECRTRRGASPCESTVSEIATR